MWMHNVSMATELSRRISFLTHDIARRSRYWFDARAKDSGMTRAQWRLLTNLTHSEGSTQSDLAERMDVERITLCRMVDRLAEAGMIERRADPSDRRVWRLYLTEKAKPAAAQMTELANELEENMLSPLTSEQRETLAHLLTIVRDHIHSAGDKSDQQLVAGTKR